MTFRQWIAHIRQWFYTVIQFPMPRKNEHMWIGIVGERKQICLVCNREGIDRDISEDELNDEREMNTEWDLISAKYWNDEDV